MNSQQIRILIVDHVLKHRAAIEEWCLGVGFIPRFASSGAQAIVGFRSHHPGLVLVRSDLPDRQGSALLRRYHDDDAAACLPIVAYEGDLCPGAQHFAALTPVFVRQRFLKFLVHKNPASDPYQGVVYCSLEHLLERRRTPRQAAALDLRDPPFVGSTIRASNVPPAYVEPLGLERPLVPVLDPDAERTGFDLIDRLAQTLHQHTCLPKSVMILEGRWGSARAALFAQIERRLAAVPVYLSADSASGKPLIERFRQAMIDELTDFTAVEAGVPGLTPYPRLHEAWSARATHAQATLRSFLKSENRVAPRLCVLTGMDRPERHQLTELSELVGEVKSLGMSLAIASSPDARLDRTIKRHSHAQSVGVFRVPTIEASGVEAFLHAMLRRRGASGDLPRVTLAAAELLSRKSHGGHEALGSVLHHALHRAYLENPGGNLLSVRHVDGIDPLHSSLDSPPLRPRHEIFSDPRTWDDLLPLAPRTWDALRPLEPHMPRFGPRSLVTTDSGATAI